MRTVIAFLRAALAGSLLTVLYTNLLYPVSVGLVGAIRGPESSDSGDGASPGGESSGASSASAESTDCGPEASLPSVSLVVAAYNEEDVIADKIENSLALDYPDEKLEILVFSDASSDATDDIVRSYEGVELIRVEGRVGKTECQNVVADRADGDILVFSDANSMYEPDAIRRLVARFDDDVGCVVGGLHYDNVGDNTGGIPVYRRFERFVQRAESRTGSIVKGNGAIYAVRADDYVPLAPDLMSDFAEPMAIRSLGKRVTFAPDAVALERARDDLDSQRDAENRITTRSWHTLSSFTELLNPAEYGTYSVKLWSRTVLLWLTPVFLGVAGSSALLLTLLEPTPLHLLVAGGFGAFALSVGVTAGAKRRGRSVPLPLQATYYFALLNYSLLVGLSNFLRGRNVVTWDTDERTDETDASEASETGAVDPQD
ncbi:glycosyltransferase family 2 protein [Halorussus sp. MSC15.2]|uniref:glycosyltransferase family 2 protein n=1 Tax=Halorussus sp. MSC15.2 TaxID=2283638 RepID=UPI0013D547B1|nr:glycosyltransferase family 2 protein [Halorussus sp. MSC15.2]NEU58097.1 glycosyltransferase family 2 protein [Halorussus sp. MSC15.2]